MWRYHRNERISLHLGLKKMRCGKLCVICDRIGATDLKLHPQTLAAILPFKQYINTRAIAEQSTQFGR